MQVVEFDIDIPRYQHSASQSELEEAASLGCRFCDILWDALSAYCRGVDLGLDPERRLKVLSYDGLFALRLDLQGLKQDNIFLRVFSNEGEANVCNVPSIN